MIEPCPLCGAHPQPSAYDESAGQITCHACDQITVARDAWNTVARECRRSRALARIESWLAMSSYFDVVLSQNARTYTAVAFDRNGRFAPLVQIAMAHSAYLDTAIDTLASRLDATHPR